MPVSAADSGEATLIRGIDLGPVISIVQLHFKACIFFSSQLGGKENASFKMKLNDANNWTQVNSSNESGFSAIGSGYRHETGYFLDLNTRAYFWVNGSTPKYIWISSGDS